MLVREAMTRSVETIGPADRVQSAAAKMRAAGVGLLAVCEDGAPVGVLTDRDIAVRSAAEGKDPARVTVREAMTPQILSCRDSDTLEAAVARMREYAIRRIIVLDVAERLAGILSVDDIALHSPALAGEILEHALAPDRPVAPRMWPWRD